MFAFEIILTDSTSLAKMHEPDKISDSSTKHPEDGSHDSPTSSEYNVQ
jgi:hypothetical protein